MFYSFPVTIDLSPFCEILFVKEIFIQCQFCKLQSKLVGKAEGDCAACVGVKPSVELAFGSLQKYFM